MRRSVSMTSAKLSTAQPRHTVAWQDRYKVMTWHAHNSQDVQIVQLQGELHSDTTTATYCTQQTRTHNTVRT
jgi:lipopolysaccharide export system protein LptA